LFVIIPERHNFSAIFQGMLLLDEVRVISFRFRSHTLLATVFSTTTVAESTFAT